MLYTWRLNGLIRRFDRSSIFYFKKAGTEARPTRDVKYLCRAGLCACLKKILRHPRKFMKSVFRDKSG